MERQVLKFPNGFLWGSAVSSYQVEGGIDNNDWAQAAREKKVPLASAACDHYNRFEEDFDIAKKLNQNAHRFSVEWARIEPEEGRWNFEAIEHYREILTALRKRNIEPFITLWHFTLPLWFSKKGGWVNKKSVACFVRYSSFIADQYKDLIKFWITINEPTIYASHSYITGKWPPQKKKRIISYFRVTRNLIKAHKRTYEAIKEIDTSARIGIAKNNAYFEAYQNKSVNRILKRLADKNWNFRFLDSVKQHQDFIGLNHYHHNRINFGFNKNENKIVSDMGWELYPEAMYYVLCGLRKYKKPIYVLENGLADAKDEKREWFIEETLKNVHRAIKEGARVKGYFYWSLLDNFEWADGYRPKFGLVEVDFKTQKRTIRPSAYEYSKICRENRLELT